MTRHHSKDPFTAIRDLEACLVFNRLLVKQAGILQEQIDSERDATHTLRVNHMSVCTNACYQDAFPYITGRIKK